MLRDEIIEFMLSRKYRPMSDVEIANCFPNYTKEEVVNEIKAMKDDYLVMESKNKNGNLILASKKGYYTGVVTGVFEDHIYVKLEKYEKDFKIAIRKGEVVLPKDTVLLHLAEDETFEKVVKRDIKVLVGEVKAVEKKPGKYDYFVIPKNKRLNLELKLDEEQCKDLVNGHIVKFELEQSKLGCKPLITEIIGYKDDPNVDIKAFLIEAEAPIDFSEACIAEANAVNREVNAKDLENRTDFRDHMIFTIDGEDAKDFDDAVEVYEREDGGFKIGVHIADVSEFVAEGGAMDNDAYERGTSIYLVYSVIPMLPQIISNGCCSLKPHEDRLTMSFIMDIDSQGNLESGEVKLGVINSKKRWTYKEVNDIVENKNPETIAKNKEFIPMINAMMKASAAIRANRDRRGQLELDIPEAKIITDENGHPIDITTRYRGLAEMAIEDLMVLTNEFTASLLENIGFPCLYRVHEEPSVEKMENFIKFARSVGHKVKNKQNGYGVYDVKNIIEEEDDELVKSILSTVLLRGLPKAKYSPENVGHFGLASDAYAHTTSPIRRYPDLIVHRILKKYLLMLSNPEKLEEMDFDADQDYLYEAGEHTSMTEKRSEQLERDVEKMKKAEFMQDKIGEVFEGKISGFTERGMFVQLSNTVEGYIKFDLLKDDIYVYDKGRMLALGKKTGNMFKLGSEFKVKVIKASKSESVVDFAPSDYKPKKDPETGGKNNHSKHKGKGKRHG